MVGKLYICIHRHQSKDPQKLKAKKGGGEASVDNNAVTKKAEKKELWLCVRVHTDLHTTQPNPAQVISF